MPGPAGAGSGLPCLRVGSTSEAGEVLARLTALRLSGSTPSEEENPAAPAAPPEKTSVHGYSFDAAYLRYGNVVAEQPAAMKTS
jgi:hypothetical protein